MLKFRPVILSLSLTGAVSQVVKVLVGRPRPDLIARCMPRVGATNSPVFGLVTSAICTQTNMLIMRDGFRSFPSAHSSRKSFFTPNSNFGNIPKTVLQSPLPDSDSSHSIWQESSIFLYVFI